MALLTPYAEEVALELAKHAVELNVEGSSPLPAFKLYTESQNYALYPYQLVWYEVPSISPDSTRSWSLSKQTAQSSSNSPEFYDTVLSDNQQYKAFEKDTLRLMAVKNGGKLLGERICRAEQTSQTADDSYRKQRERNNHAAKQSRDRRKLREVRQKIQVTYLKKKVSDLRDGEYWLFGKFGKFETVNAQHSLICRQRSHGV